jgi:hypothetical protein
MLSWYPNSTLHCMLHIQPSQWQHKQFRPNVVLLMSHFQAWAQHRDMLAGWPSVVTWLWLWAGPPCSWGMWVGEPGPPGWGSLGWDSNVWLRVLRNSNQCVIALQIAGPPSRQRGRPTWRRKKINVKQRKENLVMGPTPRRTGRLTVGRNITWTWKYK